MKRTRPAETKTKGTKSKKAKVVESNSSSEESIELDVELSISEDVSQEEKQKPKKVGKATKKSKNEPKDDKKANAFIAAMTAELTGVRPGEILFGVRNTTKDCLMQISGAIIPPRQRDLDEIRFFPELWTKFLGKLGSIDFFSSKSNKEREAWLQEHQTDKDLDIAEVPGAMIEVLALGESSFVTELPQEDIEKLSSGKPFGALEVRDWFPRKPGSTGIRGRQTLMFYRNYWKVTVTYKIEKERTGLTLDLQNGTIKEKATCDPSQNILVFSNVKCLKKEDEIGVIVPSNPGIILNETTVFDIILEYFEPKQKFTMEDINAVRKSMKTFTAASMKSLLQKIIRFRPKLVEINKEKRYGADFVLAVVCGCLMIHPGAFVPDIQRFVTGLESFVKRLVVIYFEDSCISPSQIPSIVQLAICAFLAQRSKQWKPTKEMILDWILLAVQAWMCPSYYSYNIDIGLKQTPYKIEKNSSPLMIVSALLDEVKSFHSDLAMIRHIVAHFPKNQITSVQDETKYPEVMPWCHCVDQHWAPDIVYFFPYKRVQELKVPGSKPFSKLLKKLFDEVTGINPRKGIVFDEKKEFIRECRRAQELFLMAKQAEPVPRESQNGTRILQTTIDKSWIAGMAGATEIKGKPPVLVTLRSDDVYQFVAIRKPSRDMKEATLLQQREEEAIEKFKQMLIKEGINLNCSKAPIPQLQQTKLFIKENKETNEFDYYFKNKKNETFQWDDIKDATLEYPILKELPSDVGVIRAGLRTYGEGVQKDADDALYLYMKEFDKIVLRRVIMYLSGFRSEFEMNRVSRDGGSTKQAVVIEDVHVFTFLLKLCVLYPSALRREKGSPTKFEIPSPPLLWDIRDKISKKLCGNQIYNSASWGKLGDTMGRKTWEHQVESLKEMKTQHESGKKGHFLWIPVGMGKTLIVLSYLKYLQSLNQLPKYIIYTLPSSAIKSILVEIEGFGFGKTNLIVPTKKSNEHAQSMYIKHPGKCILEPNVINLIEHDHLRLCESTLVSYAPQSIFIVDEVHKALNETLRTAAALQLSHVAEEFIALTGTPVIDSNTYKLIWWLQQIVSFEVNEKNFWVAANSMVAKKVCTGVIVDRQDVEAPLRTLKEKYQSLVGPNVGGRNPHPTLKDFQQAIEVCYDAASLEMVEMTKQFLAEGKGVMVVAHTTEHQKRLKGLILSNIPKIKESDIFLITNTESIFLTDDAVKSKKVHDFKVVITTIRKSEGYTLTRLQAMVTSVYPSNNATREQIEGRINRIGQAAKTVHIRIVHCGLLTFIYQKHADARNLSAVLQSLADEIQLDI